MDADEFLWLDEVREEDESSDKIEGVAYLPAMRVLKDMLEECSNIRMHSANSLRYMRTCTDTQASQESAEVYCISEKLLPLFSAVINSIADCITQYHNNQIAKEPSEGKKPIKLRSLTSDDLLIVFCHLVVKSNMLEPKIVELLPVSAFMYDFLGVVQEAFVDRSSEAPPQKPLKPQKDTPTSANVAPSSTVPEQTELDPNGLNELSETVPSTVMGRSESMPASVTNDDAYLFMRRSVSHSHLSNIDHAVSFTSEGDARLTGKDLAKDMAGPQLKQQCENAKQVNTAASNTTVVPQVETSACTDSSRDPLQAGVVQSKEDDDGFNCWFSMRSHYETMFRGQTGFSLTTIISALTYISKQTD